MIWFHLSATKVRKKIEVHKRYRRKVIEFKNVYKTYPNGFTALKNINLQIEQGEFVAIIGLSGAGKSTILRCINRMHDITKGELKVDGVDVDSLIPCAARSCAVTAARSV